MCSNDCCRVLQRFDKKTKTALVTRRHLSLRMESRDGYLLVAAVFISAGAFLFPVSVSGLSARPQRTTQHPSRGIPDRIRGQQRHQEPFSGPGRSQSDRQQLKYEHLNRYRLMILQQLGLPDNRTDFRVPGSTSGGGAVSNRTAELMRIEEERKNQQTNKETRKNLDKKNSRSHRETVKTILFGEKGRSEMGHGSMCYGSNG